MWWLPVPCISSGGYIQASATWHFWSVGLSALLSNPDPQLCWLMVTFGASGVCTRCLTLHLAAVLCHGKCPVSSVQQSWHSVRCLHGILFPASSVMRVLYVPTKDSYIQQYLLRLTVSRSFIHWKVTRQCLNLILYIKYSSVCILRELLSILMFLIPKYSLSSHPFLGATNLRLLASLLETLTLGGRLALELKLKSPLPILTVVLVFFFSNPPTNWWAEC